MYKCQPSFFSIKNSLSAVTLQTICSSVVLFALFIQKTIMNDSTAPLSYECDRLGSNDDNFFFQQNIINIFTARFIKNSPLLWFMLTRFAKLQWVSPWQVLQNCTIEWKASEGWVECTSRSSLFFNLCLELDEIWFASFFCGSLIFTWYTILIYL